MVTLKPTHAAIHARTHTRTHTRAHPRAHESAHALMHAHVHGARNTNAATTNVSLEAVHRVAAPSAAAAVARGTGPAQ